MNTKFIFKKCDNIGIFTFLSIKLNLLTLIIFRIVLLSVFGVHRKLGVAAMYCPYMVGELPSWVCWETTVVSHRIPDNGKAWLAHLFARLDQSLERWWLGMLCIWAVYRDPSIMSASKIP